MHLSRCIEWRCIEIWLLFPSFLCLISLPQKHLPLVRFFFWWSIFSCIYNFILSGIDLTSIGKRFDCCNNRERTSHNALLSSLLSARLPSRPNCHMLILLSSLLSYIHIFICTDSECLYIWDNFDHSAYGDQKALFLSQCNSYAFVFFCVVMAAMALCRMYYIWLIRSFYQSIDPVHRNNQRFAGYGYSVSSNK